jgi:hypothetical protein
VGKLRTPARCRRREPLFSAAPLSSPQALSAAASFPDAGGRSLAAVFRSSAGNYDGYGYAIFDPY